MDRINYDKKLDAILDDIKGTRPKLLLHSCCGPCSSYVIDYLKDYFSITILYYNPNIEPKTEYEKRKQEQIKLIKEFNNKDINILDIDYDNESYRSVIKGHEKDLEGGERCHICYELRLSKTAKMAKELGYDYFCTTLTVSPYKNSYVINEIGEKLQKEFLIQWLYSDFKKKDGYKKSIELSKKYNLYRQNYCGCLFSKEGSINE